MKTLMNKNKIRLAGGLAVLLMTAILAVTTAKSYATCWHLVLDHDNCVYSAIPNCWLNSCTGFRYWYCAPQGDVIMSSPSPCKWGPGLDGYGFANCTTYPDEIKVENGYTSIVGSCMGSGCVNVVCTPHVTGTLTLLGGSGVISGSLTCQPGG
jgi:hypothetical protein